MLFGEVQKVEVYFKDVKELVKVHANYYVSVANNNLHQKQERS